MGMDDLARRDPAFLAELEGLKAAVDSHLATMFPDHPEIDLVEAAMHAAVRSPGKRLRPLTALLAARDADCDGPAVMHVGAALELVHAASLVLDDLPCMDDATVRRGRPAIHVRFGEDVAVLAAIALLTRAYAAIAESPGLSGEQRAALCAILSDAVGPRGLVGGQLADLRGDGARSPAAAAAVNERKTGALFVAALEMACIVAGLSRDCRGRFRAFGRELGQAFQILDDLLDLSGDAQRLGKPTGQDAGKPTVVRLIGEEAGWRRLDHHLSSAVDTLDDLPNRGRRLAGLIGLIFAARPADLSRPGRDNPAFRAAAG